MPYHFDTGILLRAFDSASPDHASIVTAWRLLRDRDETITVAVQNIAEFWNVSTRPAAQNGYGLSQQRVRRRVEIIEQNCRLLTESPQSYAIWKQLAINRPIVGVAVHDARLASVMLEAGITNIVTLNARDFRHYMNITPLSPQEIVAS